MDYTDKIFLWLGKTSKTEQEFNEYFKLDYSENENKKICGFCQDIEKRWYDEDFIGYIKFQNSVEILEILKEVPINKTEKESVVEKCKEIGLNNANAVYWYSDEITPNPNISYNGLKYIGEYLAE